jgi:hypothetical protein
MERNKDNYARNRRHKEDKETVAKFSFNLL